MSQSQGQDTHDGDDSSLTDKLKHPFHNLKEKLKHTHLHDAKVGIIHQKYVLSSIY
jgi:phospholipase D1/2